MRLHLIHASAHGGRQPLSLVRDLHLAAHRQLQPVNPVERPRYLRRVGAQAQHPTLRSVGSKLCFLWFVRCIVMNRMHTGPLST